VSGDKISASRNLVQPSEETAPAGQRRANANHFPGHLFRNWRQLKSRLRTAKACALFLDLDGTLVPLRPRPADVQLARQTKRILKLLQGHTNLHLAFVSGRQLKVLRSIIGMDQVSYVGLHGAECEGKSLDMSRESVRALSAAKRAAKKQLQKYPGIWIEDKRLSFAVHYWRAKRATVRAAELALNQILAPKLGTLHILNGNKVWEVMPKEIPGKGVAVCSLLTALPENTLGIYVGDDVTDETAFAALSDQITVKVGRMPGTQAHFYVRDPGEVHRFLTHLETLLS
jgi:trehalose 6-phosphate phosphatase